MLRVARLGAPLRGQAAFPLRAPRLPGPLPRNRLLRRGARIGQSPAPPPPPVVQLPWQVVRVSVRRELPRRRLARALRLRSRQKGARPASATVARLTLGLSRPAWRSRSARSAPAGSAPVQPRPAPLPPPGWGAWRSPAPERSCSARASRLHCEPRGLAFRPRMGAVHSAHVGAAQPHLLPPLGAFLLTRRPRPATGPGRPAFDGRLGPVLPAQGRPMGRDISGRDASFGCN